MPDRPARSLILVGYRGTGKTTVGRLLTDRVGLPFVDADRELEARAGRSIPVIFREQGEEAFRDLESRVLAELGDRGALVLATGGGVVLRESNRRLLRELGLVVWLVAPPDVLTARLAADGNLRPALTTSGTLGEIEGVLAARRPYYEAVADLVVETAGRSPEQVADAIIGAWTKGRSQ